MDAATIQAIYTHLGIPESSLAPPTHTRSKPQSPSSSSSAAIVYLSFRRANITRLDLEYFVDHHMLLVQRHWAPRGLKTWDVVKFGEDDASGLIAQCAMVWESREAAVSCLSPEGPGHAEIAADDAKYLDGKLEMWIGEVC